MTPSQDAAHKKYALVIAWHNRLRASQSQVQAAVNHAVRSNAPQDAIFWNERDRAWVTIDEIASGVLRDELRTWAERYK